MKEPKVHVGILFEPQIEFILLNPYRINGMEISGKQVVTYNEGRILSNCLMSPSASTSTGSVKKTSASWVL